MKVSASNLDHPGLASERPGHPGVLKNGTAAVGHTTPTDLFFASSGSRHLLHDTIAISTALRDHACLCLACISQVTSKRAACRLISTCSTRKPCRHRLHSIPQQSGTRPNVPPPCSMPSRLYPSTTSTSHCLLRAATHLTTATVARSPAAQTWLAQQPDQALQPPVRHGGSFTAPLL